MAKFMMSASYSAEGAKGLMKDGGSARRAAVEKAAGAVGAKLEAFYYALGDEDVYIIVDAPDTQSVVALSLAVNASGAVRLKTTPLVSLEDVDAACRKSVSYRAPGA